MTRVRDILAAFSGVFLASAHFLFIYVFAAIACARDFADAQLLGLGIVPIVNGIAGLAALIAAVTILLAAVRAAGHPRSELPFLHWLMGGLAAAAVLSIVWNSLPLLLSSSCG